MNNKISNTKQIFRIIDQDLDKVSVCSDVDRPVLLHRLKTINEELCDQVVSLVRVLESQKQKANEQEANRILQQYL